jgi:hypothetical protein
MSQQRLEWESPATRQLYLEVWELLVINRLTPVHRGVPGGRMAAWVHVHVLTLIRMGQNVSSQPA